MENHGSNVRRLVDEFRSKSGETRGDAGGMRRVWENLLRQVEADAAAHLDLAAVLQQQLSRPILEASFHRKIQSRKVSKKNVPHFHHLWRDKKKPRWFSVYKKECLLIDWKKFVHNFFRISQQFPVARHISFFFLANELQTTTSHEFKNAMESLKRLLDFYRFEFVTIEIFSFGGTTNLQKPSRSPNPRMSFWLEISLSPVFFLFIWHQFHSVIQSKFRDQYITKKCMQNNVRMRTN